MTESHCLRLRRIASFGGLVLALALAGCGVKGPLELPPSANLADWLVRRLGMPFREAHRITGEIVTRAAKTRLPLHRLPLAEMQAIEPRLTEEVFSILSVTNSVKSRTSFGGTAPSNVRTQARKWLKRLARERGGG